MKPPALDSNARSLREEADLIDLGDLINEPLGRVVVTLAALIVLLVIVVIVLVVRQRGLGRRIDHLTRGDNGRSLEAILGAHLERVQNLGRDVDRLEARSAIQEADLRRSMQRIGVVRFNPFEDTGGNQSFALALLDQRGNGIVISSLHGRGTTRIYAKTVTAGKAESAASAEEAEALRQAMADRASGAG